MRYLHTMVRISNIEESLNFYCNLLGLIESKRITSEEGRFTNIFLCAPSDKENYELKRSPAIELTYNWDSERYTVGRGFGHLAFRVKNIYSLCEKLMEAHIEINRPPRDGNMAFIQSPDGISIELLQEGEPMLPCEPWISMKNVGSW